MQGWECKCVSTEQNRTERNRNNSPIVSLHKLATPFHEKYKDDIFYTALRFSLNLSYRNRHSNSSFTTVHKIINEKSRKTSIYNLYMQRAEPAIVNSHLQAVMNTEETYSTVAQTQSNSHPSKISNLRFYQLTHTERQIMITQGHR